MARLHPAEGNPGWAPGVEAFAARLSNEAQEARLHNLEAALHATRARHQDEVHEIETLLQSSRLEAEQLRKRLSQKETQLAQNEARSAELAGKLKNRDAALAERDREIMQMRAIAQTRDKQVQQLQTQVKLLLAQVRSSNSDASAARMQKEQSLAPLSQHATDLERSLLSKEKQLQLLKQEVDNVQHRSFEIRASAAEQQDHAAQVQSTQEAELAYQSETIRHLEGLLESQEQTYRENEQSLKNRCRLLQAWCFRMWWSLEGSDANTPGLLADGAAAALGVQSSERRPRTRIKESGGRGAAALQSIVQVPLPDDWRSVLRFQATLFHWLTAEAVRGKALHLQSLEHDVEMPLLKKAGRRHLSPSRLQEDR